MINPIAIFSIHRFACFTSTTILVLKMVMGIVFFKQKIYNIYIIYDDDSCICDHILQTMILNMSTAAMNGKPGR